MIDWSDKAERDLLQRFPKTREPLPPEYAAFHEQFYTAAREGKHAGASVALKLEEWMHRLACDPPNGFPLLELGAGTLNHVKFERADGRYDVVEPMKVLYDGKSELSRITHLYADTSEVPSEARYKRIVSIATFEHILNAPEIIARSALLLDPLGNFRAGIPSEGGLMWYLAYMFGTGTTFRLKYGLDYSKFQRYEHVNKAWEIEGLCRIFFKSVRVQRWPFPFLHGSIYTHIDAWDPKEEAARAYLRKIAVAK